MTKQAAAFILMMLISFALFNCGVDKVKNMTGAI